MAISDTSAVKRCWFCPSLCIALFPTGPTALRLHAMVFVDFLPAQVDAASSTKALPFTSSPSGLVWSDVILFFRVLSYVWTIVAPMYPFGSGKLDEMYPSFQNIVCMV